MDQNQKKSDKETANDKNIRVLSWSIATNPKLYRELAENPYSRKSLQIISEKFPKESSVTLIRAIIYAEPEGMYDRNFKELGEASQKEEIDKQKERSTIVNKHFIYYCNEHKKELDQLSKDVVYNILSLAIFEAIDTKEIEFKYSQKQRRDFKLSIVNFIEGTADTYQDSSRSPKKKFIRKRPFLFAALAVPMLILLIYIIQHQLC